MLTDTRSPTILTGLEEMGNPVFALKMGMVQDFVGKERCWIICRSNFGFALVVFKMPLVCEGHPHIPPIWCLHLESETPFC